MTFNLTDKFTGKTIDRKSWNQLSINYRMFFNHFDFSSIGLDDQALSNTFRTAIL